MSELGEYLKTDIRILVYLYESPNVTQNYSSKIAKELKIPPVTVHENLSMLSEKSMLKWTQVGRMKFYELTQNGVSEVKNFLDLLQQHHKKL